MAQQHNHSSASTPPHQQKYRAKMQTYLLKGKLTSAEIMLLEIERRKLKLSPAEASAIEAEVKRSARQAKATRLGVMSIFLLGFGTMTLLLQAPSRQALSLTQPPESSRTSIETFTAKDQGSEILKKARQIVQQRGDFDVAIATATQIPRSSLLYPEVQTQILRWQQQKWQAQNAAFQRMEQAHAEKNWQTVLNIAKELPQTRYWLNHQGVLNMMITAKAKLLLAERTP